jgi:hypothetical protein
VYISGRGEVLEYIYEDIWGQTGSGGVWMVWGSVCGRLDMMETGIPCGGRCNGKFTRGTEIIILLFGA